MNNKLGCFFSFVLIACISCEDSLLFHIDCLKGESQHCGLVGQEFLNGKGICSFGIQRCISGGAWGECLGEVHPGAEVCDGRDNNCDAEIDETFPQENQLCGMLENVSYGVGICVAGTTVCEDGYLRCEGHAGPSLEICDGIDNNCNGSIDESIPNQTVEVCYDGPPNTLRVGECKAGVRYCREGELNSGPCEGQTLPSIEICDRLDNDCDGEVDEGFDDGKVDLIFIIDISGSFDDEIEKTIYGIEPLLSSPITQDFQFGLMLIGTAHDHEEEGARQYLQRLTDFVPRERFMSFLETALNMSRAGTSGLEPSYDALAFIPLGEVDFSFREDSQKVVILMTDEGGQTFEHPPLSENYVAGVYASTSFFVHVYNKRSFHTDFDTIISTPQHYHSLEDHSNAAEIFESLRRIFLNICGS